ncbi:CYTH domain-containing protein [Alteromonas oceanisediminis]|uniref:CYTH domain-containing protein n=1 Tax=Alteromonas oceanisediminis TaxID=2836180 RepID=UPI001BD96C18|nr:CYTH domain-containing protein [Alteromonas oceanisediminis]MBT0585380.1 CYTH domain-containing protein [Alteromonas oceanisediminis]
MSGLINELEMKFALSGQGHAVFREQLLPNLSEKLSQSDGLQVDFECKQLTNHYYDTQDFYFAKHRFGFRVRGCDGVFEQTLKTHGSTTGGLHQRGEYNIQLQEPTPDLTLFSRVEWPDDAEPSTLTKSLSLRFKTDFERNEYTLRFNDAVIELVFDRGEVSADGDTVPIDEVEIELKTGNVDRVFELARLLNNTLSLRLSDTTKAASGYHLIGESLIQPHPLPEYLPLAPKLSTEDAFCQSAQKALMHWQYHEQAYLQTHKLKYLDFMVEGVHLLLHCVSLYLPVLQCPELLKLHKQLISFSQRWQWVNELNSIRYLRSKRGPFSKYLNEHDALMSYLQGRKMGLLQGRAARTLFFDSTANNIKLLTSEVILKRPWQATVSGADKPVLEHARGWLSQGWQNVMQSLSQAEPLADSHYVATEHVLRQALTSGFLLADLFGDERGEFRAPWLDILSGIQELRALLALKSLLREAEFDQDLELKSWAADKIKNLLHVIERTRRVAIQSEAYW